MRFWVIGIAAATVVAGCNSGGAPVGPGGPLTKLIKEDVKPGSGPGAKRGDVLIMEYKGQLGDGTVFDATSMHDNAPFQVVLGQGKVIKGWDQGLVGMKEGGERKLSIPANLAYGAQGGPGGKIPPNADLFFDIKCDKLIPAEDADNPVVDHLKSGSGPKAKMGDTVTITYREYTPTGQVLDDNGGKPYDVLIGTSNVFPGLKYSMIGRQKGDTFRLTIPPKWQRDVQIQSPDSQDQWVMFDVKVLGIKPGK